MARASRLAGLGLCDHDTVEGNPELLKAGQDLSFPVFGGVELSVDFKGTTHLLGLDLLASKDTPPILDGLQEFRRARNQRLFDRLIELGFNLTLERIEEISGGGQLGRPHFARALIEKGYCNSVQDAFDKYLGKNRPAYVDKVRPTPLEALAMLHKAKYAPVLAHPYSLGLPPDKWLEVLPQWKKDGLLGLEVYHPDHTLDQIQLFTALAHKFDLIITAGSDFHGANKKTPITWVKTHSPVGLEVLGRLREKLLAS
jgi:predicted metal-dependent phosphoesterase TrpH